MRSREEMAGIIGKTVHTVQRALDRLSSEWIIRRMGSNHLLKLLKLRTVVCLRGISPVDVVPEDGDPILLRRGSALPDLALNALFPLVVGGIAGIDDGFYLLSSFPFSVIPVVQGR